MEKIHLGGNKQFTINLIELIKNLDLDDISLETLAQETSDVTLYLGVLPVEIFIHILSFLPYNEQIRAKFTCKDWSKAVDQHLEIECIARLGVEAFVKTINTIENPNLKQALFKKIETLNKQKKIEREIINCTSKIKDKPKETLDKQEVMNHLSTFNPINMKLLELLYSC